MTEPRGKFDWLAFSVRTASSFAVTTILLIQRRHHRAAAIWVAIIGYGIFPVIAYFHTQYYNLKFMGWIIDAVRRRIAKRHGETG
jgi:hypothetical protein